MPALEGLAEAPERLGGIDRGQRAPVFGGDEERQGLALQLLPQLPVLTPVVRHPLPLRLLGTLHLSRHHIPGAGHVGDEDEVEVRVSIHCEVHAASLLTRHPAILTSASQELNNVDLISAQVFEVTITRLPRQYLDKPTRQGHF